MIDAGDFRAWLESAAPGSVVGRPGMALACPLARWLEETVVVGTGGRRLVANDTLGRLPSWAEEFLSIGTSVALDEEDEMTREEALAALDMAEGGPAAIALNFGLARSGTIG